MPSKPISAAAALGKRLYVDTSKLDEDLGLPQIGKPTAGSGVNEDFTNLDLPTLSSKSLARYLQYSSGMHSFALVCCAKAENHANSISEALGRRIAELRVVLDVGAQKYKLDAHIDQDENVTKLRDKALIADAKVKLYKAYVAAYEARTSMFSRELSRRASETMKGT